MRVADLGLKTLPLGARVVFTHRCSGVHGGDLRDVPRKSRHAAGRVLAPHPTSPYMRGVLPRPSRRARGFYASRGPKPLTVWVATWPEVGEGVVVGLTHRCEGWSESFGEDGLQFDERDRYPAYQVKAKLNGATLLIPAWACVPFPPVPWRIEWRDGTPASGPANIYLGSSVQSWDSWVDRVVGRGLMMQEMRERAGIA